MAEHHLGPGLLGYLTTFAAVWWAWMTFTWFASAYDTDDAHYRYWDHLHPMGRVLHLHRLDLKADGPGRATDLFEGLPYELPRDEPAPEPFDAHPDGRSVAFAFDPSPVKRNTNRLAIAELDLATRRVRQLPEFGFDQPLAFTGGKMTIDSDRLFNGSPERYDWKILGKQSMIIPYNAYGLDDTRVKYQDLLGVHHINPVHTRYEMHRIWVVEATLKPTYRHKYAKRVIFVDEDTWQPVLEDNYDSRGQLWRVNQVNLKYIYGTEGFQTRVTTYNDILRDAYVIDRMTNEAQQQPRYGKAAGLDASMFTPDYSRRMGR